MALKLAGEEIGIQEIIDGITYAPGLKDSGDLEAGTKTITATSEASGVGNADYSKALTLPKPSDARLVVKRIAARLAVTIDSFDTATHLYCRVYVDAQDANHRLFDEDWDGTGAKLDAVDTHSGAKSTIFDLLKGGAEHTFYFFFWVNQANNAVISLVQLWEAVGSCTTRALSYLIKHSGFMQLVGSTGRVGTGTSSCFLMPTAADIGVSFNSNKVSDIHLVVTRMEAKVGGTVATDLNYAAYVNVALRSVQ